MDQTIINAARALGEVAGRSPPYVDAEDLWTGLMRGDTDAVTMYSFGTQLRTNRRSRMSIDELRAKPTRRNTRAAKDEVWMLYCIMRRRAAPYALVPEDAKLVDAGRQQVRRGVKQGLAHHSGHALPERAAARLAETWEWIRGSPCIAWIDNFYAGARGVQPDETNDLNTTAIAIIRLRSPFPYFHGQPSLTDMHRKVHRVGTVLRNTDVRFAEVLRHMGVSVARSPKFRNIRQPLDVVRDPQSVDGPQWRPLHLSAEQVTGTTGLVNVLQWLHDNRSHTAGLFPMLADENIHYRVLKLLYGNQMGRWDVPAKLRYIPLVYGVWHAYKVAVTVVFRKFLPFVSYLRYGTLGAGKTIGTNPSLGLMERTIGCLLKCMGPHVMGVRRKAQRADREASRSPTRRNLLRKGIARGMLLLCTEYAPMLLYIGFLVREGSWNSPGANTSNETAIAVQKSVLCLLKHLNDRDTLLPYERTIGAALLYQTEWHEGLPGHAWVEEFGEALLSLLAARRLKYRGAVEVDVVDAIFQTITVKKSGGGVGRSCIKPAAVRRMSARLARYALLERTVVSYVEWTSGPGGTKAKLWWPAEGYTAPSSLTDPLSADRYRADLTNTLKTLIRQTKWKRKVVALFDGVFPYRTPIGKHQYEENARRVLQA